jgi:hypothetical protein
MTPAHDFIVVGEGVYRCEVADVGIVLHVDRLRRKSGELWGELTVTCSLAGAHRLNDEDVISAADLNFSSVRARQDRASLLSKRSRFPEHDWFGSVEYFCQRTIQAERVGQPSVLLRDVRKPAPDLTWTVHGLPIVKRQPMILFGDGGAGKSTLALSIAGTLAQQGIPGLYCDWETDEAEHRQKLEELFGDTMPDVRYVRCASPLIHEVDRLRREILVHGIEYIVVDSAGVACSGAPEAAESANEFFRGLRQLHVGALVLAHVTKSEGGEHRPFGSVFWGNNARSTWFVKRSDADGDAGQMTLALWHRKSNSGPLLSPRGLRLRFGEDQIEIRPTDLTDSEQFAPTLPLWQRMKGQLSPGPMTLEALAEEIGAKPDSVKKVVDRSQHRKDPMFTRVVGADGQTRISLVARRFA